MPALSVNLKSEYNNLFNTCSIHPSKYGDVESVINKILSNKNRYVNAGKSLNVPWYFIAAVNCMESGSFDRHFHNGDPLTYRTKQVPAGRPVKGNPPFTWEQSVEDALIYQGLDKWKDWSLPGLLYKLEEYNGWGYRSRYPHVLSPYLWSFSNHYTKGKYVKDGTWSETAVSRQCGAAVILRRLAERGEITFGEASAEPAAAGTLNGKPIIKYSVKKVEYAMELQAFLNKIPGIYLKEDGVPGKKTSAAVKQVFGFSLKDDPDA